MSDKSTGGETTTETQHNEHVKAFFLTLAQKNTVDWNKWHFDAINNDVQVTFAGVDFRAAPNDRINFAGFDFGNGADFSGCIWGDGNPNSATPGAACFDGATFGNDANFTGAIFGRRANFTGANFRGVAKFTYARFSARADFPGATFERSDFTHATFAAKANFRNVTFGPGANFTNVVFGNGASFNNAAFGQETSFDGGVFGHNANFNGASFGDAAQFSHAKFDSEARFVGTTFDGAAFFDGATFGDGASFVGSVFGNHTSFIDAIFGDSANFDDAVFCDDTIFNGASFADEANFEGIAFGWRTSFAGTIFEGDVEFKGKTVDQASKDLVARMREAIEEDRAAMAKRHEHSWTGSGSAPDRFLTISFAHVRFDNEAVFSARTFEADADFTNARFYYPPDFDAVINASRIDFTGAYISFVPPGKRLHLTTNGRIPVRLRAFRKFAEETKNHDLERDLYIEERKAERGVKWHQLSDELKRAPEELKKQLVDITKQKKDVWSEWRLQVKARIAHLLGIAVNRVRLAVHGLWIVPMFLYWALSDYGRNFVLPSIWLGLSVPFFYWRYREVLALLMHEAGSANADKYNHAEWMLALGNAVPFVGPLTIDSEIKKFLFCPSGADCCLPPIPPEGFQFLVIFQNLFSIICVFFIGLALRNYFRIK